MPRSSRGRRGACMKSSDYRHGLESLERSGEPAIVSASFDLRPGVSGFETATAILREAIRSTEMAAELTEHQVDGLRDELTVALETAVESGAEGLFVAGTLESPTQLRMEVAVAPRHTLEISPRVAWFELERYQALTRPAVAGVWADRSLVRAVLVQQDNGPIVTELEADTHYMERSTGRTGMHGRGGSAAMPAGGHGKTRIEQSAEEERERFAREAAAHLRPRLEGASAIVLHGTPEFEARLLSELSTRVRAHIVSERGLEHQPSADELAQEARNRAVGIQFEAAEEMYRQVHDGAAGDRALSGPEALLITARQGRLGSLVFDEDAVGHLGDAMDARVHAATQDAERIRELLDAARESSASCWFVHSDAMAKGAGGAAGILRW
jgi:hypothetical protein